MGILSAAGALSAQRAIEVALPDVASITRVTRTQDATTGGYSETEATFATGIPCRVDKSGLSSRERVIADRYGAVETFRLMLSAVPTRWPGNIVNVQASDHVTVTGDAAGTYELAEVGGPVSDELAREAIVVRIS